MKIAAKIFTYINTIRYLKMIQLIARLKKYFITPAASLSHPPEVALFKGQKFHFIPRPKTFLGRNSFKFLNVSKILNTTNRWNDTSIPKIWLYNLHYFDGLMNHETSEKLKKELIDIWIMENSPGVGNGWEPYPISIRVVNWIKWSLSGHELSDIASKSVAVQVRYLSKSLEYHLLGNHLFANAKALVFAGLFFDGDEADEWFRTGTNILERQIPEQFLDDGSHFELSTTYHALLTEDLLDIIQLMQHCGKSVPNVWKNTANRAMNWLVVMTREDGLPPLFNDAAYGITPSLDQLLILYDSCNLKPLEKLEDGLTDLCASGYFRFKTRQYSLFGDAGQIGPDYIPGHAHCDMLNFELFAHGKPIIVDTGISTYEVCGRRHIERSTASHNTVQIGDNEQSEIWGSFRVARRARIVGREVTSKSVRAKYNTYISSELFHDRKFQFEDQLIMIDDIVPAGKDATARFHFHPGISVSQDGDMITAGPIKLLIAGQKDIKISSYDYAPEFNKLLNASVVEISFTDHLKTKIIL